jgi:carboxylesterase
MVTYYSGFSQLSPHDRASLIPEGVPFWLKASQNPTRSVVVCLHGFTATPFETLPIAKQCVEKEIDAVGPLMPGHGIADLEEAKRVFSTIKWTDWVDAVAAEIIQAKKIYQHVFVYGQSMGGALTCEAAEAGWVEAGAMTAPALILPRGAGFISTMTHHWNLTIRKTRDLKNKFVNYSYAFDNSKAGYELLLLSRHARANLAKISCPLFIAHSHNDPIITPIVPPLIQARVQGPITLQWFDRSLHTMPLDVQGGEVAKAIGLFFADFVSKL